MGKMSYYDMNRCLCKELSCWFEKFEETKDVNAFNNVKEIVEVMVGLTELEAAGAMREYFEDEHGYDSHTGEFQNRDWRRPFTIYNTAPRYPMKRQDYPDYAYPTMPYGADGYDMMNRGGMDGREDRDNRNDRRSDYGRGDYQNDGGDIGTPYNRNQSRDSRGRYNEGYGIYNMAHMDGMKHKDKLSNEEIKDWMENLESNTGEKGPMWTKEEVEAVAKKEGIKFDKFSPESLYAMANVAYSDYCETGEKFGVDTPAFYVSLAKDFLVDPDSATGEDGGDKKLATYYETIVEH